jgi:hypothetical protein
MWQARAMRRLLVLVVVVALSPSLQACCCCEIFFGNFVKFTCRSKQSEAKGNLRALAIAQANWWSEHERFGSFEEIGFEPAGETIRYQYLLLSYDESTFVAEARGVDEMDGDVWRIEAGGEPENTASVCGDEQAPPPEQPPAEPDGVQHVRY